MTKLWSKCLAIALIVSSTAKQVAFALTQKCDLVGKLSVFLQAAALLPNHFRINQPTISDVSFLI